MKFLRDDLNIFISNIDRNNYELVLFANLNAIIDRGADAHAGQIIISIVNIEEDRLLQNSPTLAHNFSKTHYDTQAFNINITCLITFYNNNLDNYEGIELLEYVMQYFQNKPIMNLTSIDDGKKIPSQIQQIKAELVSLDYHQTADLWSLFGGNYFPSLLYKFKMLRIEN